MSQPSFPPALTGADAPTRDEERPEPLNFTLSVVSPSVGVASPLSFPHLPATTTVKQLKAKIRDALASKPADESQRLIHRGRMLGQELDTMLDIFGQETLANPEPQTLHLVLRPAATDGSSSLPSVASPVPVLQAAPSIPAHHTIPPRPHSIPPGAIPSPGMNGQQPLPGFQHVQQHQALHQAEHFQNLMAQRLQQIQRETQRLHQEMAMIEQRYRAQMPQGNAANILPIHQSLAPGSQTVNQFPQIGLRPPASLPSSVQNLIAQQQRERAANGQLGAQDTSGSTTPAGNPALSGRASPAFHRPDHTTTYTREGVGPNGERWHMTVNETTTTLPIPQAHHPHSSHQIHHNPALDVQAVLRNADRFLAAQAAQNNMQRSTSDPVPGAPQTNAITNGQGDSSHASQGDATLASSTEIPSVTTGVAPPLTPVVPLLNTTNSTAGNINSMSPSTEPTVYILSSPSGPRALLVSNSETFFTPRQSSRRHRTELVPGQAPAQGQGPVGLPEFRNRHVHRARRNARQENPLAPIAGAHAHGNPAAAGIGAQAGPFLWLIVRLVGFVWFFTSGNTSWARWFVLSGVALVVFLFNTGIFNGLVNEYLAPVRRHLENLIPLAGPDAALVPAANAVIPQAQDGAQPPAGNNGSPGVRRGELDPAQVAARLIEQRRQANGGWLMAQIRRAEHSVLLFLASLVPGVGERHIAAREAEATAAEAERQRLVEAAAAVAAAAENPEGSGESGATAEAEASAEAVDETGESQSTNPGTEAEGAAPPAQPLIEV